MRASIWRQTSEGMPCSELAEPASARQGWQRVASTHSLEELLLPGAEPAQPCSRPIATGCLLLSAGALTAAGAACLLHWLVTGVTPSDMVAWGYMSPMVFHGLLLPCWVPLGLALVTWNWLSLKLFKFSV